MPNGIFYLNSFDRYISSRRGIWLVFFLVTMFAVILVFNVNNVHPDQMPPSAASAFGLHCLPISLLLDARDKYVVFLFHLRELWWTRSLTKC